MMDAVDFLRACARMCRKFNSCSDGCPIWEQGSACEMMHLGENAEQAVASVEQWAQEHPSNTRQSELLKLFPGSALDGDGILNMCPSSVSESHRDEFGGCYDSRRCCNDCRREFWMQEVERWNG